MSEERLGSLNGWQVLLFRINLILAPILATALVSFGAWTVTTLNNLNTSVAVAKREIELTLRDDQRYFRNDAVADDLKQTSDIQEWASSRFVTGNEMMKWQADQFMSKNELRELVASLRDEIHAIRDGIQSLEIRKGSQ